MGIRQTIAKWINGDTPIDGSITQLFPNYIQYMQFGNDIIWQNLSNSTEYKYAYEHFSPLSSIINHKAKAYADGYIEVLNPNTDNYVRGQYKAWEKLLETPNFIQSGNSFFKQLYSYVAINGYAIVLKVYPSGFRDLPTSLWVLPYWCIEVDEKLTNVFALDKDSIKQGIYFTLNGRRTKLEPENIIIITDDTGVIDDRIWLPKSRISLLRAPISIGISSLEAEMTMQQKRGALGIFSNEAKDAAGHQHLLPEDKESLQRDMQQYGLSRAQYQYIVTSANLKWQPVAPPIKDLMTHESYRKAIMDCCNAYSFPYELTPYSERKTLANVDSFDTILYQNAIIPEANSIDQQLTMGLLPENIKIRHDYSDVPALQQGEKEKGEGMQAMNNAMQILYDNNLITKNEWLKAIGRDTIADGDKFKNEYGDAQQSQGATT